MVSSTKVSVVEGAGPSLGAEGAIRGLSASSSLPEELPLLSLLSLEVSEALALVCPVGVAVARWSAGTSGFLTLLVPLAGTGSVPRALST